MIEPLRLAAADMFVDAIAALTFELPMPASFRTRAAGGCFALAQEHHHGSVILLHAKRYASALALLRLIFESYIRGAWLDSCAEETEVKAFLLGTEPPSITRMLAALDETERFFGGVLVSFKQQYWSALCDFTHSGGMHVQRWNTMQGIEQDYSPAEVNQALVFAEYLAALAAIGIARLAGRGDLTDRMVAEMKRILRPAATQ